MAADSAATGGESGADRLGALRRAAEGILGVPATEGNAVQVLRNGDEIFPAMLSSIEEAKRTIDFLTFVYWRGDIGTRFANALAGRAQEGVRVRVLLDAVGAAQIERSLLETWRTLGCGSIGSAR